MRKCAIDELDLDMVDDALRELVNMTAGQIKRELAPKQLLGLPEIIDCDTAFAANPDWVHLTLGAGDLVLVLSLAERVF
jgi:hypothetical protein